MDRQDRARRAADAARRHLQQPRQRQHQRLQAVARGVRGPALPDDAPARRAVVAADAAADRPADRHRRAPGRDRAHLHARATCSRPATRSTSRSTAQGFFQVLLPDGTTAYTRDGSFHLDSQGQIVTSSGYPLQPAITIPANALSVTIGADGTVTVTQPGSANADAGRLDPARELHQSAGTAGARAKTCTSRPRHPARPAPTRRAPTAWASLNQGYVETSNVNVVEELVNMIADAARVRDQFQGRADVRPDAAAADADLDRDAILLSGSSMSLARRSACAVAAVALAGCAGMRAPSRLRNR